VSCMASVSQTLLQLGIPIKATRIHGPTSKVSFESRQPAVGLKSCQVCIFAS